MFISSFFLSSIFYKYIFTLEKWLFFNANFMVYLSSSEGVGSSNSIDAEWARFWLTNGIKMMLTTEKLIMLVVKSMISEVYNHGQYSNINQYNLSF